MEGLICEGAYNKNAKKALNQAIVVLIKMCFDLVDFK